MTTPTQPGRTSRAILFLSALATAIGVPMWTVKLFPHEIAAHPLWAYFILLCYEVFLLVLGLSARVGEILMSHWAERLAGWIDRGLQTFVSAYLRRYLQWVFYQHRDFDVKGLTTQGIYNLELDQVFVDLTIEPKPAHATSADPIRSVPLELAGRKQIWEYLESDKLTHNLVLIGAPGSGKTTLLKKIALQMTGRRPPRVRQTVPLLLFLREHADRIASNPNYSLADAVRDILMRKEGPPPPAGWFEAKLRSGRCLILLDGLDEVAKLETRQLVVTWAEERMKAHAKNRFLITSRPHGYRSNPILGVTVLEVQPLSRHQVETFIYKWYTANEIRASGKSDDGIKMKARAGSADLLQRLSKSQTLIGLAVNPLLLTMIATVHRFRSSLPGRRVELYAEICEVFLGKRQQAREISMDLTPAQRQLALQPLAYYLMQKKSREIPLQEAVQIVSKPLRRIAGSRFDGAEREFLQEIENGSGLLLERELQVYSFAHLAFQEYLAAVHAREENLGEALARQVTDPWWNEAIRLYCAQEDASPILEACLSTEKLAMPALALAIDCLEEARDVDPKWREAVENLLTQGIENQDRELFCLAAEAFLTRRLRDLAPMKEGPFVDTAYITNAEYQLFLDEEAATGHYNQPDHWLGRRFSAGTGLEPILGVRRADAKSFCAWLNNRDGLYAYRLPWAEELKKYGLQEVSPSLAVKNLGYWTEGTSRQSFEWLVQSRNVLFGDALSKIIQSDLVAPPSHDSKNLIFSYVWETARSLADRKSIPVGIDSQKPFMLDQSLNRFQSVVGDRSTRIWAALKEILRHPNKLFGRTNAIDEAVVLMERNFQGASKDLIRSLEIADTIRGYCDEAIDLAKSSARDPVVAEPVKRIDLRNSREAALSHVQNLAQSLGRTIALLHSVKLVLTRSYDPESYSFIRWALRVFTLDLAVQDAPAFSKALLVYEPYRQLHAEQESARPLYADLLLLEARIQGFFEAFEGIRIVRESKA